MLSTKSDFEQGDIVWAQFPLTDKIDKLKRRPILIISNRISNSLDGDYIVIPITKTIRNEPFALIVESTDVNGGLPVASELRCNKPFTIRRPLLYDKIGELADEKMKQAIQMATEAIGYHTNFRPLLEEGMQL